VTGHSISWRACSRLALESASILCPASSGCPARFGFDPAHQAEWGDVFAALRRAVDTELTPRQREIFVAIVVNGVPLDTLVLSLGSSRNAIYTMMFDARRKLRTAPAANGYLPGDSSRGS
jgi:RNA polymerase sigma-70 factor, ECF subfamily